METSQVRQTKKKRLLSSYPTYEEWKPYNKVIMVGRVSKGSYPTYEEWKRNYEEPRNTVVICSYPTYEEWKQENKNQAIVEEISSYPTYEEWKRPLKDDSSKNFPVLILPMRNGKP